MNRYLLAARDALVEMAALIEKFSINEVVRSYQNDLENYVVSGANGNMTAMAIRLIMKQLIGFIAEDVYIEGMREGGDKDPAPDEEDKSTIKEWIAGQMEHVKDFADASVAVSELKGDEKTSARDTMLDRVGLWVTALANLGNLAALRVQGNPWLTYDGDDGTESCTDCQKYKLQRHKLSWWENRGLTDRPNTNYECGRYQHCHHHFYNDDGEMVID